MYVIYDAKGSVVGVIDPDGINNTNIREVLERADYTLEPLWKVMEGGEVENE